MLEETRARLLSGEINSRDPVTFFKQWYDATSEIWEQVIGEVMSSERFMEAHRQFIETDTSAIRTSHHLNEELFRTMQLPTRSDIARVAGLVVSLEEKVDTIEDALEGLKERFAQAETSKAGDGRLEKRLQQIERKLDTLLATLKNDEAKVNPEAPPLGNGARRKVQKRHEDSPQVNKTSTGSELP